MDHPLLEAILARWRHCFANETINDRDLRLFRSLEMARAASKVPGGADANIYDAGRAVALWVSAFEILVRDEDHASPKRVLSLLSRVQWLKLKGQDRKVALGKKKQKVQTNVAGEVYAHLNSVRNDFLHGNPVTDETLKLKKSGRGVLWFAAPLFRLALTAFLDLRFSETLPDTEDANEQGRYIARRMAFHSAQRDCETHLVN